MNKENHHSHRAVARQIWVVGAIVGLAVTAPILVTRGRGVDAGRAAAHQGDAAAHDDLREPGNGAFAAIREVVVRLGRDSSTDWSRVDLESLRRHLVDMENFTVNVEVLAREPVPGGLLVRVRGIGAEAHTLLERALAAHPAVLRDEVGWEMQVRASDRAFDVRVTSERAEDVPKIRGLGYIGVMATGAHHTRHHLAIATGSSPHAH